MSTTKHHFGEYISGYIFCKICIVSWNITKSDQSVSNWTHDNRRNWQNILIIFGIKCLNQWQPMQYTPLYNSTGGSPHSSIVNVCSFIAYFPISTLNIDIVHWSAAPHNRIANRTGFSVYVVLVLNVIRYSCHYFLDRIIFHHDFHYESCDYHWDFHGH